ncbi:MAG: TIGR03757 family integrating conjugative element protein [Blastocatellia bacterium]
MRLRSITAVSLAALLAAQPAGAEPVQVEVFSDAFHPVAGIAAAQDPDAWITNYDLDAAVRLTRELGAGLPRTLEEAKAFAMARIDAIGVDEVKRRYQEAYGGLFKAFEYGIRRYPAIVFDQGAAVVYGVADLSEALRIYRNWKAAQ